MKLFTLRSTVAAALAASATGAFAGGLDRSGQDISALFENGTYAEFKVGYVDPSFQAVDAFGRGTGNVVRSFVQPGLAFKKNFGTASSFAILLDRPVGVDVNYATAADGGSPLLGGTFAKLDSLQLTGLVRQKFDGGFGLHGGLRAEQVKASLGLGGQAFGGLNGYKLSADTNTAFGFVAGGSYERPEIAMRVAFTYHSVIRHDLDSQETTPIGPIAGEFRVKTPQSWNLTAQSGVAANTVVIAGIRWAEWSNFRLNPTGFTTVTRGTAPNGIVRLDDVYTYTLGVGHRFNPTWTGLVTLGYEETLRKLKSPVSAIDGFLNLTVGAVYRVGNLAITGGVSTRRYGNAFVETGGAARAKFNDNSYSAFGLKVGYEFK